jgi:hypothetical protein
MMWRTRFAMAALFLVPLAGSGPVGARDAAAREYLDPQTAASITVANEAFVFARERLDLAVNARDYVTLVPIEINRAGTRNYYWFGYLWSTIDRRDGQRPFVEGDELVLLADGRPIRLRGTARSLREEGISEPPLPRPGRAAVPVLMIADPEAMNFVGRSTDLSLLWIHENQGDAFPLWRDARAEMRDLLAFLHLDTP